MQHSLLKTKNDFYRGFKTHVNASLLDYSIITPAVYALSSCDSDRRVSSANDQDLPLSFDQEVEEDEEIRESSGAVLPGTSGSDTANLSVIDGVFEEQQHTRHLLSVIKKKFFFNKIQ